MKRIKHYTQVQDINEELREKFSGEELTESLLFPEIAEFLNINVCDISIFNTRIHKSKDRMCLILGDNSTGLEIATIVILKDNPLSYTIDDIYIAYDEEITRLI